MIHQGRSSEITMIRDTRPCEQSLKRWDYPLFFFSVIFKDGLLEYSFNLCADRVPQEKAEQTGVPPVQWGSSEVSLSKVSDMGSLPTRP